MTDPLTHIASELKRLTGLVEQMEAIPPGRRRRAPRPGLEGKLRDILAARRLRTEFFPPAVKFGEPSWDMLLDLMVNRLSGTTVTLTQIAIAAAVPQTTAIRWAKHMIDSGFIFSSNDNHDRRRVIVELTDEAADEIIAWADAVGLNDMVPQ